MKFNPMWKKWQCHIDGEPSGEFNTPNEAVNNLKNAGVKMNKNYTESKFTKQDLTEMIRKVVKEEIDFDGNDFKLILNYINSLASAPTLHHHINDKTLIDYDNQVKNIRIKMMEYVEQNSNYTFIGKSPSGFKLVKKK